MENELKSPWDEYVERARNKKNSSQFPQTPVPKYENKEKDDKEEKDTSMLMTHSALFAP